MRLLVVDDDPVTGRGVAETVRRFGFQASIAHDGIEAWQILQTDVIPIVVTDWMMPGEDGIELCRRIRAAGFSYYTYIIFLTARTDKEDKLEALSFGADDFIPKPFDPVELRVRLQVAQRIVNLERDLRLANAELEEVNADLKAESRVDRLTSLGNRLSFEERIDQIHAESLSTGRRYAVVMCDLDRFKAYNDTLGHQAGDRILKEVSSAIRLATRQSDLAYRYGGEEIVLVLADQDCCGAARIAERVRRYVESLELTSELTIKPFHVTISCGVASFPENAPRREWGEVVEAADQALYDAKRTGRNRVVMAGDAKPCGCSEDVVQESLAALASEEELRRLLRPEKP